MTGKTHANLLMAFEAAVALPAYFAIFEDDVPMASTILREWADRSGYEIIESDDELRVIHCKPRQGCDIAIHLETKEAA